MPLRDRLLVLIAALLAAVAMAIPAHAWAAPVNTGHIEVELVAQQSEVAPGSTTHVALRQKIAPHWHTYWRNPGDAGQATQIAWTLPPGWNAGDIVWAKPQQLRIGPLMDYGYEGEVLLPVPLTVPASARPGSTVTLKANAAFLVCEETCIPESADLTLDLKIAAEPAMDLRWGRPVADALAAAPKPAGLEGRFQWQAGKLTLAVTGAPLKGADMTGAYFFPYAASLIDHPKPQVVERGPDGLTFTLAPGYDLQQGRPPAEIVGVVAAGAGAWEVTATPGAPPAGAAGLGPPPAEKGAARTPGGNLAIAILSAFLGGLILNLMPCVFPVLSIKAASLAGHGGEARGARAQGLAFLAGVVATFLALAGGLLALKAGGQALGWGFQLQSPAVVAVLALTMLLTAVNLSGVYEIGTSVQGAGQGLASKAGLAGAFFTGALAVVVAAPCTAPFMAPALGFALVQPAPVALAVFLALALGFAAPFTALTFMPALLDRLPRPGAWMEGFKHLLAFPMYGAAAWLTWVLAQQTDPVGFARLMAGAVLAAFGAWLLGVWQRRGQQPLWQAILALAALLGAFAVAALGPYAPPAIAARPMEGGAVLAAEPWSPARVAELRAAGRPVLVNFTAAWCVTCQVNDRVALETRGTADAFKAANAVYLVADWTNRNPEIAAALAEHGRAGVPLYLVYPADGGEPVVLPQLLTEGAVVRAIGKAAGK